MSQSPAGPEEWGLPAVSMTRVFRLSKKNQLFPTPKFISDIIRRVLKMSIQHVLKLMWEINGEIHGTPLKNRLAMAMKPKKHGRSKHGKGVVLQFVAINAGWRWIKARSKLMLSPRASLRSTQGSWYTTSSILVIIMPKIYVPSSWFPMFVAVPRLFHNPWSCSNYVTPRPFKTAWRTIPLGNWWSSHQVSQVVHRSEAPRTKHHVSSVPINGLCNLIHEWSWMVEKNPPWTI